MAHKQNGMDKNHMIFSIEWQNSSYVHGKNSYTNGWFMLSFDRKQQNSVKQLSFI